MTKQEIVTEINRLLQLLIDLPEERVSQPLNENCQFEALWRKYPSNRRESKPKCLEIFKRDIKSEEDYKKIAQALEYYLNHHDHVQKGFVKLSITWFRDWRSWYEVSQENQTTLGIMKHLRSGDASISRVS